MTPKISFLFSAYRQKVLGLLLLHPNNRYHVREIARITHTTAGTLHKELSKLAKAHVLLRETIGNQVYYQANTTFPIFLELASILRKTSGLVDILKEALLPIAKKIKAAFIFGSVARGTDHLNSDIDVLIIGDISFNEAVKSLYPIQDTLKREINPKVYTLNEWQTLVQNDNAFIKEILRQPIMFIAGKEDDIR